MKNFLLLSLLLLLTINIQAQTAEEITAEEIVSNYIEVTGGAEKWNQLKGFKMSFTQKVQGMELAGDLVSMKDGKNMIHVNLQGNDFYQNVYDGETLWGTNYTNMKAEKEDNEALQNFKNNDAQDFPQALFNYDKKGYSIELVGSESIEGVECSKVKLTKKPILKAGVEKENIEFYYFDTESNILVATESTQDYGGGEMLVKTIFGDYDEVEGLYFPFSIGNVIDGQEVSSLIFSAIELNPEVESSMFAFPEE